MRTTIHKTATRFMYLPVLAVLTFSIPENGSGVSGNKAEAVTALQSSPPDLNGGRNHASSGKCYTPARPLFRPGYGNR